MDLAYLDPGSGSQLAMAIVAGFAGAMVAIRVWWRRVLNLFRRQRPADAGATAPASNDSGAAATAGAPRDREAAAPVGKEQDG